MHRIPLAVATIVFSATLSAEALQIGAWVGSASDTSLDGSWPQPTEENVSAFVELQGRKIEYLEHYIIWPGSWNSAKKYADVAANHGATLFATWQPNGYTAPDIVGGKADAYIGKFARDIRSYPREVWLRPLHEANGGDWYTWAVGNSSMANTNENVAEAFRHIVKIFRDSGVTNVKWVWTTNAENMTTGNPTSYAGTYPGDAWCDYISIDGYNFGKFHTTATSGWNSSWKSFTQVFKPAYTALAQIDKPIFIAEFSSSELGGNKAQWYRDAFASLATTFPRLFALMIFSNNDANGDWRINTTDASLQAWRECVATYAGTTAIQGAHASRQTGYVRVMGRGRIAWDLSEESAVRVQVRDLHGRILETRELGVLPPGTHDLALGRASGVRLVQLDLGDRREVLRLGVD
jgi:beta-mannanase